MLLAIVLFVCSIAFPQPIFSVVKPKPQNLALVDRQIYEQKLAENDGTGELREFIQKLEEQNETIVKVIEKCEPIEEREDAKLAQIYFSLRAKLGEIKRGEKSVCDEAAVERLRKSAVEAVFVLAKRMEIQREQIEDKANENKNENKIEILKKLAKNWDQNNWKRNGNQKGKSKNSENSYQNQRETLKMILAAIGDGNNGTMGILAKNSNSDGSSRRRRRKKRVTTNMTTAFVVAIIIILALLSYFLVRPMVLRACQDSPASSASTGASSSSSTARGSARTSGGSSSSISSMTSSTRSSNTSARTGSSSGSSSSRASAGGTGNTAPTLHFGEDPSRWDYWFPRYG